VPVLYLILRDHNGVVPPTLNTLYNQVIPEHYKTQVRNFGVIGGITRTVSNYICVS
jgi:ubiquitin-like-conjugating enzyme ATG10